MGCHYQVMAAPETNPEAPCCRQLASSRRAAAVSGSRTPTSPTARLSRQPAASLLLHHPNTLTCPHPLQGRQQCTQGPRLLHCSQQVVPAAAAAAAHSSKAGCTDCSSCLAGQSTASLYAGCMMGSYSGVPGGPPGDRCCATRKHADQRPCHALSDPPLPTPALTAVGAPLGISLWD